MQTTLPSIERMLPTQSSREPAPFVLLFAMLLGCATQALFFGAGLGFDWLVWDCMMVTLAVLLLRRGPLRWTAIATMVACVLFGVAFVSRRSIFTAAIALPANVIALAALPVILREDLGFLELGSLPARAFGFLVRTPRAAFRTVFLPSDAIAVLDERGRGIARRTIVGLLLGLPAAGVFTLLLAADPGFASTIDGAIGRLGTAGTFAIYSLVSAVLYSFAHSLLVRTPEPIEEEVTIEPRSMPYRGANDVVSTMQCANASPTKTRAHLAPLTWGIVVAQVAAVFLVFVLVHRETQFGGHALVRAPGEITYARHLHAGFYQLLFATMLSVSLVLVGHRLLRAKDDAKIPGGIALSAIESTLLVLTGITLLSCAKRLRIYEEAYGATHLRIGVALVGLAVLGVLVCTLAKSIFRGGRFFGGAVATTLTAVCLVGSAIDADAYVARTNLDRYLRGATLDERYLQTLTQDACAVLSHPALVADRELGDRLYDAWMQDVTSTDVRGFRGLRRCPIER